MTLSAVVRPLDESIVGRARRGLVLLFAAIVAVLAIACSNLTNLAVIRALARSRDGAIRSALGAATGRLVRRALLDHLLLAAAGGGLGLWVAYVALRVFVQTAPIDLPRVEDVALDGVPLGLFLDCDPQSRVAGTVSLAPGDLLFISTTDTHRVAVGRRDAQGAARS